MLVIILFFNFIVFAAYEGAPPVSRRARTISQSGRTDQQKNSGNDPSDTGNINPPSSISQNEEQNPASKLSKDIGLNREKTVSSSVKTNTMHTANRQPENPTNEKQPTNPLELLFLIKTTYKDCGDVYKYFPILIESSIFTIVEQIKMNNIITISPSCEESLAKRTTLFAKILEMFMVKVPEKEKKRRKPIK